MRRVVVLLFVLALTLPLAATAPRRRAPVTVAPDALPHAMAMFLGTLSRDGGRQVTFKATAVGMRFFFEEPSGVTVYVFNNGRYVKEEFLRGDVLNKAIKRYAKK